MGSGLGLVVCQLYGREAAAIIEAEGFSDVHIATSPVRCLPPTLTWTDLIPTIESFKATDTTLVIGGHCLRQLGAPLPEIDTVRVIHVDQCFYMLANRGIIDEYQKEGAYLVTAGWVGRWREWINQWGFDRGLAREFFQHDASRVVMLDTGLYSDCLANLADFAAFIDRPYQKVPVGLDYFRLFLCKHIIKQQCDDRTHKAQVSISQAQRSAADFALAVDLLRAASRAENEVDAVNNIMELFTILCAPGQTHLLTFSNSQPAVLWSCPPDREDEAKKMALSAFQQTGAMTETGHGFRVRFGAPHRPVAVLEVDQVAFPDRLPEYLNLALAVSDTCALAIDNARHVQQITLAHQEQARLVSELQKALAEVKTLSGLIPICASCKQIRDDAGYWQQIEQYITNHSAATFTHGICPACARQLYPELFEEDTCPAGGR